MNNKSALLLPVLLLLAGLLLGCSPPATTPGATTSAGSGQPLATTPAATDATTPAATSEGTPGSGLLEEARLALADHEPEADPRPAVDAVLGGVAAWLDAGGQPSSLSAALGPVLTVAGPTPVEVREEDLDGDGQPDVVLRVPLMGLPLFVFVRPAGAAVGHALPEDLEAIRWDFPLEQTEVDKPALDLRDLTGDGSPEILWTTMGAGASSFRLRPWAYQWREDAFRLVFAADLVNWAGTADYMLEPDPTAQGRTQFVLTYPHLYAQGFDHKMVNHPQGRQVWRWDRQAGRYVRAEQTVDLASSAWGPDLPPTVEDRLRWLTNEAEALFRAGEYSEAVAGHDAVLRLAAGEAWQPAEGEPDWAAYAAFRRAEALIMAGETAAGSEAMAAVASELEGDLLGDLARAFLDGYAGGTGPAAAARAVAAMQQVPLYDHFYYENPGALRFPMDAAGILYPGAGLAAYLEAHPELASEPAALQAGLEAAGYAVVDVALPEPRGVQVTLALPEMPAGGGPGSMPWLLVPAEGGWQVAQPGGNGQWPVLGEFAGF